jgi:Tannase and feruloyl esterase
MLTAITDWVEKGKAPDAVIARSRISPVRQRPLCPYPDHAQYLGQGDPQDPKNFACRNSN